MKPLTNIASVKIENNLDKDTKPVDWLDASFVPVDKIWPSWGNARLKVRELLVETKEFNLMRDKRNPSNLAIGFNFPMVEADKYFGFMPLWETFPMEVVKTFLAITESVINDFMPDTDKFLSASPNVNKETLHCLKSLIKSREHYVMSLGGRHLRQEYAYRLGFSELDVKLEPIEIKIGE